MGARVLVMSVALIGALPAPGCRMDNPAFNLTDGADSQSGSGTTSDGQTSTSKGTSQGSDSTSGDPTTSSTSGPSSDSLATSGVTASTGATTGDPDLPGGCACLAEEICTPDGCRRGVVFLNFDGPFMEVGGVDDATIDQTSIPELGGQMKEFGGTPQDHDAVVAAVAELFKPFSVFITGERPPEGPYAMIVLGDNLAPFQGAIEISLPDCMDQVPGSVSFAAAHAADGFETHVRAVIIAHAVGHTIGLDHLNDPGAVMGETLNANATFQDACLQNTDNTPCAAQHAAFCGDSQQNSFAELEDRFGLL